MTILKETSSWESSDNKSPLILWRKMQDAGEMVYHPIAIDKFELFNRKY